MATIRILAAASLALGACVASDAGAPTVLGHWRLSTNMPCAGRVEVTLTGRPDAPDLESFATAPPEGPLVTHDPTSVMVGVDGDGNGLIAIEYLDSLGTPSSWGIVLTPIDAVTGVADVHGATYHCDATRADVPATRDSEP